MGYSTLYWLVGYWGLGVAEVTEVENRRQAASEENMIV